MYLSPDKVDIIPVSQVTAGYKNQKLVVNFHEFPVKNSNRKVCFLFSHSNGFHKESFHPLMSRFIKYLRSLKEYEKTSITFVSWDARNHGDSARLNEGTFLPSYRWADNAMDTKQVIDHYELNTSYDQFIGVGHSFGATSMILVEYYYPKTFSGLVVIEPVMSDMMFPEEIRENNPLLNAIRRRDEWPSRDECKKNLLSKKFFQLLHPETFDLYVNYGMYETEKGTIKLKCPKEQEHQVFNVSAYDIFTARRSLGLTSVPTHFVYALDSTFLGRDAADEITGLNKLFSINFVKGTHMAPNEHPEVIIPEIKSLIDRVNQSQVKSKL